MARHYILNGEKMWISNAGFADLFTVFAKIDGEKFSAFLIERGTPGFSVGPEEHKLGIRGSSTCPLILADCQVPVENLLGEPGKGHHIAFNILNIGRFKLGAACTGGARNSLAQAIQYAKERKAFGKSICEFGLIQEKLAECAAGVYAGESLTYRTIGMIDAALAGIDANAEGASRDIQKRIEEYAVECSIAKVWGSEMLDMVVDHVVQIFAGYGYVEEYPAERAYRDSRINRIFEGTNEINRLIITGWLMKRAMSGQLALLPAIKRVMDEVMSGPVAEEDAKGRGASCWRRPRNWRCSPPAPPRKNTCRHWRSSRKSWRLWRIAIAEVYAMESCILRTEKLRTNAQANALTEYYCARSHRQSGVGRAQSHRRRSRRRHAAHPDGHRPPPRQTRPAGHDCAGSPDRQARDRRRPVRAVVP